MLCVIILGQHLEYSQSNWSYYIYFILTLLLGAVKIHSRKTSFMCHRFFKIFFLRLHWECCLSLLSVKQKACMGLGGPLGETLRVWEQRKATTDRSGGVQLVLQEGLWFSENDRVSFPFGLQHHFFRGQRTDPLGSSGTVFLGILRNTQCLCLGPYACFWCQFSVSWAEIIWLLLGYLAWDRSALSVVIDVGAVWKVIWPFFPAVPAAALAAPAYDQGGRGLDVPRAQPGLRDAPGLGSVRRSACAAGSAGCPTLPHSSLLPAPEISYWMHSHSPPVGWSPLSKLGPPDPGRGAENTPLSQGSMDFQ